MLRQGDAKMFKKYSQMKLQMKREALKKLNRKANEGQGVTWGDQADEVLSHFATLGAFFLDLVRPDSFGNSGSGLESKEVPFGRVAQLVRAPASHAGGHRFESCRAHHSLD